VKTISGAPLQTSQGPGPITGFIAAPAGRVIYSDAAGIVCAHPTVTLNAAGALSIGALSCGALTAAGTVNVYSTTKYVNLSTDGTNAELQSFSSMPLHLNRQGNNVFLCATGSNVGIGTTAPLSKLSINGGLHVGGNSDAGDNNALIDGTVTHADNAAIIRSSVAMLDGAGVGAGTLLNAPAAGNPTKWVPLIDNGVTRYIPAW
jgi:hypothetical protein